MNQISETNDCIDFQIQQLTRHICKIGMGYRQLIKTKIDNENSLSFFYKNGALMAALFGDLNAPRAASF